MDNLEHLNHRVLVITKIDARLFTEGSLSYINQGFSRPVSEPINGTAVDEGGEHSESHLESLSHGRHSNNTVNVLSYTLDVLSSHVRLSEGDTSTLAELSSTSHDFLLVLNFIKLRDISSVEHTVHILCHRFLNDLSVGEQEDCLLVFSSSAEEAGLKVISPVFHAVTLDNLNLENIEGVNASSKSAEGLSSRSTNSKKKGVTHRLSQHSRYTGNVIARVQEHDQFHGGLLVSLIVFLKVVLDLSLHFFEVLNILVRPVFFNIAFHPVSIHQAFR
jgi:hypothetical protein